METIKQLKLNRKTILIIGIVGILLMIFSGAKDSPNTYVSEEERLVNILSNIEGAGEVKVMLSLGDKSNSMLTADKTDKYIGAVILAEGGENSSVRAKIIKAVEAITGLDAHRIIVYRLDS